MANFTNEFKDFSVLYYFSGFPISLFVLYVSTCIYKCAWGKGLLQEMEELNGKRFGFRG